VLKNRTQILSQYSRARTTGWTSRALPPLAGRRRGNLNQMCFPPRERSANTCVLDRTKQAGRIYSIVTVQRPLRCVRRCQCGASYWQVFSQPPWIPARAVITVVVNYTYEIATNNHNACMHTTFHHFTSIHFTGTPAHAVTQPCKPNLVNADTVSDRLSGRMPQGINHT
jgi:hypothetical protein